MGNYRKYYVEGLDDPEIYRNFLALLLAYSDAFSFIYFKYREGERTKRSTRQIQKRLSPFEISAKNVSQWGGTITLNESEHVYRMVTYKIERARIFDILDVFETVETLYDWDYPKYPMDPCFYKNGYAWFTVCSHELDNTIYLKDESSFPLASDIESIGAKLEPDGKVAETELFQLYD